MSRETERSSGANGLPTIATTRRRAIPFSGAVPSRWTQVDRFDTPPDNVSKGSSPPMPFGPIGMQETASENHPGWNRRSKGSDSGDIGGDFYSIKRSAILKGGRVSMSGQANLGFLIRTVNYNGYFIPFAIPEAWPPDVSSSNSALNAFGTKAIANCSPSNSLVDLSTTLAELVKDGLPTKVGAELWRSSAERSRKAVGSEYLNVEFGWKPLVADVRKTAEAIIRADAIMRQFKRDAGRTVRRRFEFSPVNSLTTTMSHSFVNAKAGNDDSVLRKSTANLGFVSRTRETRVRRWFSGAFTYHLPYNVAGVVDASSAKKVYGADLTPSTLWNLAPWSWAVDWFVPVGDLIGNLEDMAGDGQVLTYGYIMEHSIVRDTYTFEGDTGFKTASRPGVLVYTTEVKKRRRATPFGFGLTWSGFTPRQMAIAAALGLSRGSK